MSLHLNDKLGKLVEGRTHIHFAFITIIQPFILAWTLASIINSPNTVSVAFNNIIWSNHHTAKSTLKTSLLLEWSRSSFLCKAPTRFCMIWSHSVIWNLIACSRGLQIMALGSNLVCFYKLCFIGTQPHQTSSFVSALDAMTGLSSCYEDNVAHKT